MLAACGEHRAKLFIHEKFRWQAPIREVKQALDSGIIGEPFKARVSFVYGFPVFDNQPFLAVYPEAMERFGELFRRSFHGVD